MCVGPVRVERQLAHLLERGLPDLLAESVSDVHREETGEPVEVALAVRVLEVATVAADDHRDVAGRVAAHAREVHPEMLLRERLQVERRRGRHRLRTLRHRHHDHGDRRAVQRACGAPSRGSGLSAAARSPCRTTMYRASCCAARSSSACDRPRRHQHAPRPRRAAARARATAGSSRRSPSSSSAPAKLLARSRRRPSGLRAARPRDADRQTVVAERAGQLHRLVDDCVRAGGAVDAHHDRARLTARSRAPAGGAWPARDGGVDGLEGTAPEEALVPAEAPQDEQHAAQEQEAHADHERDAHAEHRLRPSRSSRLVRGRSPT